MKYEHVIGINTKPATMAMNWITVSESSYPWERDALAFVRQAFPALAPAAWLTVGTAQVEARALDELPKLQPKDFIRRRSLVYVPIEGWH